MHGQQSEQTGISSELQAICHGADLLRKKCLIPVENLKCTSYGLNYIVYGSLMRSWKRSMLPFVSTVICKAQLNHFSIPVWSIFMLPRSLKVHAQGENSWRLNNDRLYPLGLRWGMGAPGFDAGAAV